MTLRALPRKQRNSQHLCYDFPYVNKTGHVPHAYDTYQSCCKYSLVRIADVVAHFISFSRAHFIEIDKLSSSCSKRVYKSEGMVGEVLEVNSLNPTSKALCFWRQVTDLQDEAGLSTSLQAELSLPMRTFSSICHAGLTPVHPPAVKSTIKEEHTYLMTTKDCLF